MLRFARYSWKEGEWQERGSYATYVESQNRQNGIGDREKMPRMPRIFDVKIIRTDGGPRWDWRGNRIARWAFGRPEGCPVWLGEKRLKR